MNWKLNDYVEDFDECGSLKCVKGTADLHDNDSIDVKIALYLLGWGLFERLRLFDHFAEP